MLFLLQFYNPPSATVVNIFMTRNFCRILRSIWIDCCFHMCPCVICHIITVTSISVKWHPLASPERFPQIAPRHFYLRSASRRSVSSADSREKENGRRFRNIDRSRFDTRRKYDANGRRTKELEARYNPRAVEDYEWPDWLWPITGTRSDNQRILCVANLLTYRVPSVF